MPKEQRKRPHDARSARDNRAITRCAQRSRAAPTTPRASNLLIVGTRSHEQPEKQSVIIARSAGRHSRQIAAHYPRGRSCPVRAPRDGLCGPSVARRAAHHLSVSPPTSRSPFPFSQNKAGSHLYSKRGGSARALPPPAREEPSAGRPQRN